MTKFKGVEGGTKSGPFLCETCNNAAIVQGRSETQRIMICSNLPKPHNVIAFEVVDCPMYRSRKEIMEARTYGNIAWTREVINQEGDMRFLPPNVKSVIEYSSEQHTPEQIDALVKKSIEKETPPKQEDRLEEILN